MHWTSLDLSSVPCLPRVLPIPSLLVSRFSCLETCFSHAFVPQRRLLGVYHNRGPFQRGLAPSRVFAGPQSGKILLLEGGACHFTGCDGVVKSVEEDQGVASLVDRTPCSQHPKGNVVRENQEVVAKQSRVVERKTCTTKR